MVVSFGMKDGEGCERLVYVEQVDQVESATRYETLKRDISRKTRELVGPDHEYTR